MPLNEYAKKFLDFAYILNSEELDLLEYILEALRSLYARFESNQIN